MRLQEKSVCLKSSARTLDQDIFNNKKSNKEVCGQLPRLLNRFLKGGKREWCSQNAFVEEEARILPREEMAKLRLASGMTITWLTGKFDGLPAREAYFPLEAATARRRKN
jgi:hypothetical protein